MNEGRTIRVFISSTFRDMQEERDILIKKIFPQLRKLCEQRAVTWTEVDLRWGITTEEAAEGKVLPLCLEEIHRCRPYFIGLLGERYGWVPEPNAIPDDLLESQPWLKQHLQQSVTELEILHGVFSEEPMHGHAYFYFRDAKYLESVPNDQRQGFTAESAEAAGKLGKLKQKIRSACDEQVCELRENYSTPEQLGEWILEDFTKLIDRLYPKDQTPDPIDQEAASHEAYARNRRLAFVGRENLLRRFSEHVADPGKPLVLSGESGCGKSALLAEWVARWRNDHPDDLIIQHYIGSTPDSANWQGLVRRILSELKRAFTILDDIPLQSDALRGALNDWIVKATGTRRVVIVLDALNQLADDDAARQLGWLPVVFPRNFLLLVSSFPGESLDALRKRGWEELNVPLFAQADIAPAALGYFKLFSKTPPQDIIANLESTSAACNALYLRAVLDELRQFGKHEDLKAKAAYYLSARDPKELYGRIIVRWEEDYEDGTDLVGDTLSSIWASRHGLSESEILGLLGQNGVPFPHGKWTPFFLAVEHALVVRNGLLTFGHQYLREAARDAYLPTDAHCQRAHQKLGTYFDSQAAITTRTLDERPWQWWKGQDWGKLHETLLDLDFFVALREHGESTVNYWGSLPEQFNPTNSYLDALAKRYSTNSPRGIRELKITSELANFFLYFQAMTAEPLLNEAVTIADEILANANPEECAHIDKALLDSYSALAKFLRDTNQIEDAEAAFRRAVAFAEKYFHYDQRVVAPFLTDLAWLLVLTKRVAEGETLIRRAVAILERREYGVSLELAKSLGVLGLLLQRKNNLAEAENALTQALNITEKVLGYNHPNVAQCLSNLGGVLHAIGKFAEAEAAFRRAVQNMEASGNGGSVPMAAALNNLAQLLQQLQRYKEAEPLSRRQVEILHRWGSKVGHDHPYLQASVSNYTEILQKMGYSTQMINSRLGEILLAPTALIHEGQLLRD